MRRRARRRTEPWCGVRGSPTCPRPRDSAARWPDPRAVPSQAATASRPAYAEVRRTTAVCRPIGTRGDCARWLQSPGTGGDGTLAQGAAGVGAAIATPWDVPPPTTSSNPSLLALRCRYPTAKRRPTGWTARIVPRAEGLPVAEPQPGAHRAFTATSGFQPAQRGQLVVGQVRDPQRVGVLGHGHLGPQQLLERCPPGLGQPLHLDHSGTRAAREFRRRYVVDLGIASGRCNARPSMCRRPAPVPIASPARRRQTAVRSRASRTGACW